MKKKNRILLVLFSIVIVYMLFATRSALCRRPRGDLDKNGRVDIRDLVLLVRAFGSQRGQCGWNPKPDLNRDGEVNMLDLSMLAVYFG